MAVLIALHVVAAALWVGGMFFAWMALRPVAASVLEPPQRLRLWSGALERFFAWVWVAVVVLLATGYAMVLGWLGGFGGVGVHVHLMQGLGILMMALFAHVWFAPYRRLRQAVGEERWPEGARELARIRRVVGINLVLGLLVLVVAAGGRYAG